jgi:hypothetical protein
MERERPLTTAKEESMKKVDKAKLIAEFHQKMKATDDKIKAHRTADYFLLKMLYYLGHGDVAAAWQKAQVDCGGWRYV